MMKEREKVERSITMGSVRTGSVGSWMFEGYPVTQYAFCLYCDKCGSFKIACWVPFPKWMCYIGAALFLILGLKERLAPAVIIFGSFGVLQLGFDSIRHLIHVCKKCGNFHITMKDVLHYEESDVTHLDIPYEKTIRYYQED
jgi:hypothetical protein